jgi:hypothetical protein
MDGKPTLRHIADWARILGNSYEAAAADYRRDPSVMNCQFCVALTTTLHNLAEAVAEQLPTLWPELHHVARGALWYADAGFPWGEAEVELRRIEAAALSANVAPPEPVNGDEMKILESLSRYHPETRTQEDLAADAVLSVRTVADALKRLESVGLVCRPLGPKKGYALTQKGLVVARR